MRAVSITVLACVFLTACDYWEGPLKDWGQSVQNGESSLFGRKTGGGPDETSVVPQQPLQTPPTFELPTPTPGGTNRSDPSAEAIAARQ